MTWHGSVVQTLQGASCAAAAKGVFGGLRRPPVVFMAHWGPQHSCSGPTLRGLAGRPEAATETASAMVMCCAAAMAHASKTMSTTLPRFTSLPGCPHSAAGPYASSTNLARAR